MNQFSEPEHITILRNTLRQFIDKEMPRDKVNFGTVEETNCGDVFDKLSSKA